MAVVVSCPMCLSLWIQARFVPLDTSESSTYFSEMLRTGVNNEWVLTYTNANRAKLLSQYPDIKTFAAKYEVPESGIKEMIAMMEKKEVPFNEADFKVSEHAIKLRTKALVARHLYDNEAFYEIINDLNPALKKALETLKDGTFEKMKLAYNDFKYSK